MKNIKKIMKYIASLALAVLLLWVSFREVEWKDFINGALGSGMQCCLLP